MKSNRTYDELEAIVNNELFIGYPASQDAGDKIVLVGLVCHLTNALKQKKPDVTYYKVLRMCTKDKVVDDEQLQRISLVCKWLTDGCVKCPDFGIKVKDMPAKIAELIHELLPF